jgi:hypothetical protein
MTHKNSTLSKKAIILFTNHPSTDASRKKIWFNLRKSISIFCFILKEISFKIFRASRSLNFDLIISSNVDPENSAFFINLLNQYFKNINTHFVRQSGRDFGERLINTIRHSIKNGYEKVLVIGNDSLDLESENIIKAFQELETNDNVLGPSYDGGVYLIGLSKFDEILFQNVQWYSSRVFSQIQSNAIELQNNISILENTLQDFDNQKNVLQWLSSNLNNATPLIRILKHLLKREPHKTIGTKSISYRSHLPHVIWQKSPPPFSLIYS